MRSTLGTALALSGVLLAGTAAAAVNMQALTASSAGSPIGVSATVLLPITGAAPAVNPTTTLNPSSQTAAPVSVPVSVPVPAQTAVNPTTNNSTLVTTTEVGALQQPVASPTPGSKVTYGNPNPGTSGDDADDDEENDDDDD